MGFFENPKGYDDEITQEFAVALQSQREDRATTIMMGIVIHLNKIIISKVTTLPQGVIWRKEDKTKSIPTKKNFFLPEERPIKAKNRVRRNILPYPWDEASLYILKYISCEGRLSVLYTYDFRLLYELIFQTGLPISSRITIPHFVFQSIVGMIQRMREGKPQYIAHHGIIKIIVMDAL